MTIIDYPFKQFITLKDKDGNPYKKEQFYAVSQKKTQIYLHHTVSQSALGDIKYWESTPEAVATAFDIDKNGTIYKIFSSAYWAYHVKLGAEINRKSIGIEIVNEGALTLRKDGNFYWGNGYLYKGKVVTLDTAWRNYRYFAAYTDAQIEAVAEMCAYQLKQYNIPFNMVDNFDYHPELANDFKGILLHATVQLDKSDLSPAMDLKKLKDLIGKYYKA